LAKAINDVTSELRRFNDNNHATTSTQFDNIQKRLRGGRAASINIIPSSTGAAKKAVGK
jgi:glyceraldehyde 3-phosphate dehydrogenase